MADEKAEPGSAWLPIGLLILLIGGSFLALYLQGNLGKLDAKSLLVPPPTETATSTPIQNNNYGAYQSTYSVDPNSN